MDACSNGYPTTLQQPCALFSSEFGSRNTMRSGCGSTPALRQEQRAGFWGCSYLRPFPTPLSWVCRSHGGPAPAEFFWFCVIGSLGLYATIHILLKLLLRRSDFRWQPILFGSGSRYSIRAILGTMVGSAMLMLGLKLFPYESAQTRDSTVFFFAFLAIWLAWLAMAIPTLIWLELGAVFSRSLARAPHVPRCFHLHPLQHG